jgi:hypothetical protein
MPAEEPFSATDRRPSLDAPQPIEGTVLLDWGCPVENRRGSDVVAYGRAAFDPFVNVGIDWSGRIVYAVTGEEPERTWWWAGRGETRESGR